MRMVLLAIGLVVWTAQAEASQLVCWNKDNNRDSFPELKAELLSSDVLDRVQIRRSPMAVGFSPGLPLADQTPGTSTTEVRGTLRPDRFLNYYQFHFEGPAGVYRLNLPESYYEIRGPYFNAYLNWQMAQKGDTIRLSCRIQ